MTTWSKYVNSSFKIDFVPQVIIDDHPEWIDLYNKAWHLAADHVLDLPGLPEVHHMDEGFAKDRLWIWDTCFMSLYCKYAPHFFPGIESLDNFYYPMHDEFKSSCLIHHPDNPPLFAWVELEYYKFTGDKARVYRNLVEKRFLQKHYDFIENCRVGHKYPGCYTQSNLQKLDDGYLWSGVSSGMDNTPRGADMYCNIFWVDILAQQAHAAFCIAELARTIGKSDIEAEFKEKYEDKKALLNRLYFDEKRGVYSDVWIADLRTSDIITPAGFWALMARAADAGRAERQIATLLDQNCFGGEIPVPSVARNSEFFVADGRYWRGGVWMPLTYMVEKSLEQYGQFELAAQIAERTINRMSQVYQTYMPATIFEAYAPTGIAPSTAKRRGELCRPDFCGWSALGPISLLIENVLGFHRVDAGTRQIHYYRRNIGRHGIRNLRFGNICCDIISEGREIAVETNAPFSLVVNGDVFCCNCGKNRLVLE